MQAVNTKDESVNDMNNDAQQNLVGLFELLLEIDQRNNPELYARHSDTDNS
jgi:hypothetical protein